MKGQKTKDLLLIVAILLVSVVSLLQVGKLHIDSSVRAFIPQNAPVVNINNTIENAFGALDLVVVNLYKQDGSMLNRDSLSVLDDLTKTLEGLPLVHSVTSLTNTDHLGSSEDGLLVEKLYDKHDPQAIEKLHERIDEWGELYQGNLISSDTSMASIIVEAVVAADMSLLLTEIKKAIATVDLQDLTVSQIGLPVVTHAIEQSLLSDLAILGPIVALLIIIILFLSFGRMKAVVLSLFCLLVSASIMLGIMAVFQITFTMATMLVPVLLLIVGSAYTIHILSHFYEEATTSEDGLTAEGRERIIVKVVKRNRSPLLMAGATTAAGFLAQLTTPLLPFKTFGVLCAIGVVLSQISALYLLPALLRIFYAKTPIQKKEKRKKELFDPSRVFIAIASKQGKLLAVLTLILVVGTVALVPSIHSGTDLLKFFKPSSTLVQDTRLYNSKMQGSGILTVMIEKDGDSSILEPAFLTSLDTFVQDLEQQSAVGGVQTILPFIKRMNQILGPQSGDTLHTQHEEADFDFFGGFFGEEQELEEREPTVPSDELGSLSEGGAYYEIPADPQKYGMQTEEQLGQLITQYLLLYSGNLSKFINDPLEPTALLITISLLDTDTPTLKAITTVLKDHFETTLPSGWTVAIGGGEAINLALTELVTKSQIYSLFGALIIVWFLVLILFRSPKMASFSLIPCAFALMGIFATMALLHIELDVVTSLLASLSIGIGVDYAIHLISAYQRLEVILPKEEVFSEVMKTTGKAILINAASVTLGFLGLLFSRFIPIVRMGILFCISMLFASLASLTVLPALLRWDAARKHKKKNNITTDISQARSILP